jgi:hypothetical protein
MATYPFTSYQWEVDNIFKANTEACKLVYLILLQLYQNKLLCEVFIRNMRNYVEGDERVWAR